MPESASSDGRTPRRGSLNELSDDEIIFAYNRLKHVPKIIKEEEEEKVEFWVSIKKIRYHKRLV